MIHLEMILILGLITVGIWLVGAGIVALFGHVFLIVTLSLLAGVGFFVVFGDRLGRRRAPFYSGAWVSFGIGFGLSAVQGTMSDIPLVLLVAAYVGIMVTRYVYDPPVISYVGGVVLFMGLAFASWTEWERDRAARESAISAARSQDNKESIVDCVFRHKRKEK